jgi:hypothetical protein
LKKMGNWFGSGPPRAVWQDVRGLTLSVTRALVLVGLAMTNRRLGFAHAYEFVRACVRASERASEAAVSRALPTCIEHFLGAAGRLSSFVLPVCGTRETSRLRLMGCVIVGIAYFLLTSVGWDYQQYRSTHDAAQIAQMATDLAGLVAASVWLCWPRRDARVKRQFA